MMNRNNEARYRLSSGFNAARDIGYDTDSIATFEIDKSFTDFLLCQICFSKYHSPLSLFRNEQGCKRVRLLQQAVLSDLHRELANTE